MALQEQCFAVQPGKNFGVLILRVEGCPHCQEYLLPFMAKIFGDMGYAYNKTFTENSLVNKMLYTAGAGIDVVSSYDFVFRCEYSFNQLGQSGFFFISGTTSEEKVKGER